MGQAFAPQSTMSGQQSQASPFFLIMKTADTMIAADLENDPERYYKSFKHLYHLVETYIPMETRRDINTDWSSLFTAINDIDKVPDDVMNDQLKRTSKNKLYYSFVEAHIYFAMKGYSKAIYTVFEDGRLPIDKLDFDIVTAAVRGDGIKRLEMIPNGSATPTH